VPPYLQNPGYSGSPTMPGMSGILPGDTPGEVAAWQQQQGLLGAPQAQAQVPQRNVTNQQALATGGQGAIVPTLTGVGVVPTVGATGAGTAGVPTLTGVGGTSVPAGFVAPPGFAQPASATGSSHSAAASADGSPLTQHVSNVNRQTGSSMSNLQGGFPGMGLGIGGMGMPGAYTPGLGWGAPTWSGAPAGLAYGSYGFGAPAALTSAQGGQGLLGQAGHVGFFSRLFGS
jgi:hypothetical protein